MNNKLEKYRKTVNKHLKQHFGESIEDFSSEIIKGHFENDSPTLICANDLAYRAGIKK